MRLLANMKHRIIHFFLVLTSTFFINCIGWPGPHGGLQFLGEIIWKQRQYETVYAMNYILIVSSLLALIASLLYFRKIRITITFISAVGYLIVFFKLLSKIHPPVIYIVLLTSLPFIITLGSFVVFSFLPKMQEKSIKDSGN